MRAATTVELKSGESFAVAGLFQQELSCLADFVEQNLSVVA